MLFDEDDLSELVILRFRDELNPDSLFFFLKGLVEVVDLDVVLVGA